MLELRGLDLKCVDGRNSSLLHHLVRRGKAEELEEALGDEEFAAALLTVKNFQVSTPIREFFSRFRDAASEEEGELSNCLHKFLLLHDEETILFGGGQSVSILDLCLKEVCYHSI